MTRRFLMSIDRARPETEAVGCLLPFFFFQNNTRLIRCVPSPFSAHPFAPSIAVARRCLHSASSTSASATRRQKFRICEKPSVFALLALLRWRRCLPLSIFPTVACQLDAASNQAKMQQRPIFSLCMRQSPSASSYMHCSNVQLYASPCQSACASQLHCVYGCSRNVDSAMDIDQ